MHKSISVCIACPQVELISTNDCTRCKLSSTSHSRPHKWCVGVQWVTRRLLCKSTYPSLQEVPAYSIASLCNTQSARSCSCTSHTPQYQLYRPHATSERILLDDNRVFYKLDLLEQMCLQSVAMQHQQLNWPYQHSIYMRALYQLAQCSRSPPNLLPSGQLALLPLYVHKTVRPL